MPLRFRYADAAAFAYAAFLLRRRWRTFRHAYAIAAAVAAIDKRSRD